MFKKICYEINTVYRPIESSSCIISPFRELAYIYTNSNKNIFGYGTSSKYFN